MKKLNENYNQNKFDVAKLSREFLEIDMEVIIKTKIIKGKKEDVNVLAILRWDSKLKKVYVSYVYAYSQNEVSFQDILENKLDKLVIDFCDKNSLILWSY